MTDQKTPPAGGERTDFAIVTDVSGASYVGKVTDSVRGGLAFFVRLEPAYALLGSWAVQGQSITRNRFVAPIEMLVSANAVECQPASVVWLEDLDTADRELVLQAMKQAEQLRDQLRARRGGLHVVPNLKGAPPPPVAR